jgi:hypothetical protein
MVPVRKPGRPLSACPHPSNQQCGCGSVTAAIPRKQTCHCGDETAVSMTPPGSQTTNIATNDAPSPTKVAFKVQKSFRPPSRRKQSFDPANLGRIDKNSVNILPFEQRPQGLPISLLNGYTISGPPQVYGYPPQYADIQPQYGHVPIQPPPHVIGGPIDMGIRDSFASDTSHHNGFGQVIESHLAPLTTVVNGDSSSGVIGGSCCAPKAPKNAVNGDALSKAGSCCAPKQTSHSHSSSSASSISESQEVRAGSCCSSKPGPQMVKYESISDAGTHANMTPQMAHQVLPPNGMPFNPVLYPQYLPQTTVFTYPPTYGSFANPLQPSAWRQSVRANSYAHPQAQVPLPPGAIPFDAPLVPETLDTTHTCSCGDTCQCIGCAAHPYNDATQNYVRSAWASMNIEQSSGEIYTNKQPASNGDGNVPVHPQGLDSVSSPTAQTPSSTTSGNGEEQSLSASDFFFVNYPFMSDGCGGDTQTCPCGDDCQCLGCTIHNQPAMPCAGEKEICPCSDDCECIGCEIHNGSRQPE